MRPPRFSLFACRFSLIVALVTACTSADSGTTGEFRGVALPAPLAKPSFSLIDVNARRYDFAAETRDKVALLFFGYTHCPDVCPLHMANIAAVLKRMPAEDRARVVTVFVTTDPERDTPERLREWLGNFDSSFVGLTGNATELSRAQQSVGLRDASREYLGADSANYFVSHGAQVFAFARDGMAYTIYPFGIRQDDWANDLPLLIRDASGDAIRRTLAAQARAGRDAPPGQATATDENVMVISKAVVAEPASQDEAAAYLTFTNNTIAEDTLVAVAADLAARGEVHETMGEGEMRHMMATPTLVLPKGAEVKLAPNGMHIMLTQLRRRLVAGDTVKLYLSLARLGPVEVRAPVVPYAELEKALGLSSATKR